MTLDQRVELVLATVRGTFDGAWVLMPMGFLFDVEGRIGRDMLLETPAEVVAAMATMTTQEVSSIFMRSLTRITAMTGPRGTGFAIQVRADDSQYSDSLRRAGASEGLYVYIHHLDFPEQARAWVAPVVRAGKAPRAAPFEREPLDELKPWAG